MIVPILQEPDTRLHAKAHDVTIRTPEINRVIHDLIDTRVKNKGVGLAATQIGHLVRVIALQPKLTGYSVMVNPEIIASEGEPSASYEGCLSIERGAKSFKVMRRPKIKVRFENKAGDAMIELEATGLAAQAIQHEIDHLDGITLSDMGEPQ